MSRTLHLPSVMALGLCLTWSAHVPAEDEAMPKSPAEAEMKIMDTDHNGKITAMEHTVGAKKMFEMMDANEDGMVTATEMDITQRKMMGAHGPKPKLSAADKIKVVDKDQDGEISTEEHFTASRQMFDRMDTNRDRSLTLAEMQAGHEKIMNAAHAHDAG